MGADKLEFNAVAVEHFCCIERSSAWRIDVCRRLFDFAYIYYSIDPCQIAVAIFMAAYFDFGVDV